MNALRLLMQQHDSVEGLLVDIGQSAARGEEARQRSLREFGRQLGTHLDVEEKHFYPTITGRLILVTTDRFLEEHKKLRELFGALEAEPPGPSYAHRLEELHELLVQHVSDEEIELFPEVKRRFSVDELDEMGERMEREAEEPSGPQPPGELSPETH